MFFQDGLTGSAWGDWANYTDSPLRAFENELGVQPPVGYWDPAGLAADGDMASFNRRRGIELKHGRISMIACIGYITPEYFKWPGYLSPGNSLKFDDIPNGLAAISKVPAAGITQWIAFCGVLETAFFKQEDGRAPGDFARGGILGVPNATGPIENAEERKKKLNAEIANGRLAMVAIIGMFFQDGLTGSAWGDWANYTDSPLRAFENEIGVQKPVGFWDPLGLAADGNADTFKRRRSSEIKHGRICMLATMGYITPTIAGKFPGFLSKDIAFADVPHGLKAIGTVPIQGWVQILAYCFYCEYAAGYGEDAKAGSDRRPGDMGWTPPLVAGGFIAKSPEKTREKLAVELANGRLAMMAIMGMFFQDGLTGEPWGDWALYTASPLR